MRQVAAFSLAVTEEACVGCSTDLLELEGHFNIKTLLSFYSWLKLERTQWNSAMYIISRKDRDMWLMSPLTLIQSLNWQYIWFFNVNVNEICLLTFQVKHVYWQTLPDWCLSEDKSKCQFKVWQHHGQKYKLNKPINSLNNLFSGSWRIKNKTKPAVNAITSRHRQMWHRVLPVNTRLLFSQRETKLATEIK